eukprot:gene15128-4516_t
MSKITQQEGHCVKCAKAGNDDQMLLCDGLACSTNAHSYCIGMGTSTLKMH